MSEIWRPIIGILGYECSSAGRFRSLDRVAKGSGLPIRGRILAQSVRKTGYKLISIKGKTRNAHRVIAQTFLPNPEKKPFINHKNGIKGDNRIENLEWCTHSENVLHAIETGLWKVKISKEDVIFIRENFKSLGKNNLAKIFKIHPSYIYGIATHREKSYIKSEVFQTSSPMHCKPVVQFDLNGKILNKYPSTKSAAKAISADSMAVQKVVKGKRKTVLGFVFKYSE